MLLPNLIDSETNLTEYIFFLPMRTGGLNITHPEDSAHEYERSKTMSDCLSDNSPIVAKNKWFALAVGLKKKKQQNAEESTARAKFQFFKSKVQASTL